MVKKGPEIIKRIAKHPKAMAINLHAKGFIPDKVVEEVNELNETKTAKARRLYNAVRNKVFHYPDKHSIFMGVLQKIERSKRCEKGESNFKL